MHKVKKPITIVSLFAGCGGMDLGFLGGFSFLGKKYKRNNFKIIWANEINKYACDTYKKNVDKHIIQGDIKDVLDTLPSTADLVIGGFPCQDISINGKMEGIAGKRSGLYVYMVEVVKRLRPKIFVAENVKSLLMERHAKDLQKILADFSALGYDVTYNLYKAADYGVPQLRERVMIVGTRKDVGKFIPPVPTCENYVTAKEALQDLETMPQNEKINHIWSMANKTTEQGNRKLVANKPGYTMRAECHGNIHFHYCLPRRISMREAARIQSFPDTFLFESKLRETERQIGNAVPPVLAWHVAQTIEILLTDKGDLNASTGI